MYEMLVGYPPFYSDDPITTCRKVSHIATDYLVCSYIIHPFVCMILLFEFQIVHWRNHLRFPEDTMLSPEAKDLIYRLLCDVEHRLGTCGPDQIKVYITFRTHIRTLLCLYHRFLFTQIWLS